MSQSESKGMSRRDLLRRGTAAGIAFGGVSAGAVRLDHGPVQNTEAIAPAVAAAGIGASAATGWVLRETEIIGSDDPPEGLTEEALKQSVHTTARARESTNASTFVDNENIIDQLDQASYSTGKSAALDAIDQQESESDVLEHAHEAIDEHITTIMKNLLNGWNESVAELNNIIGKIEEHPDTSVRGIFSIPGSDRDLEDLYVTLDDETHELPDGEEIDLHVISVEWSFDDGYNSGENDYHYTPINKDNSGRDNQVWEVRLNTSYADRTDYLYYYDWEDVTDKIDDTRTEVKEGMEDWVEGIYGEVQSGDIDTSQLLSATDRADMTSEDEGFAQAHADLQTLNISTDIEREAEIYFTDLDTTLYGQLAYSGDDDLGIGEIDPDEKDRIYLTYDLAQGSGLWTEYEEGLDGGDLTLTERPPSGYLFEIITTNDETATVSSDEFETDYEDDEEDGWTVDLSDQLEDTIVDFELFITTEQSTQYETTRLDEPFEIVTFRDSEGEEFESASFESSEPHTDDNYISQEEWDEDRERYEELIEKYEDSQNDGIAIPGAGDILEGEANTFIGMVVVGAFFVVTVLSALNPLS